IPFKRMAKMKSFDQDHFYTITDTPGKSHYKITLEALARIKTATYTTNVDQFLKFVPQPDKTPSHTTFIGEMDPLFARELRMYIDRGTVIYQLNEHGLEPFKLSALKGAER